MSVLTYIGSGPGLVVQGPALLLLIGLSMALVVLLTWPLRILLKRPKKRGHARTDRVVVIGLDGLEPTRVERLMKSGELPNLQTLANSGSYGRLGTTYPPLSPVAWATFSTGVRPGKHGIFGFIKREPNYQLSLASSTVDSQPASWAGIPLPWSVDKARFLRKSKSFWKVLAEHGVLCHVLRVPVTWPPEKFDGLLLSAMGAPDLLGTQGAYTLLALEQPGHLQHGEFVHLVAEAGGYKAEIHGPNDSKAEIRFLADQVKVGGESHQLSREQFTPWIELRFGRILGLVKFLWLGEARYYMTAIQIHPGYPSAPISTPQTFSVALSQILGPFATCGLAEDMGAADDGVLSREAFIKQAQEIQLERERQFFHALERTPSGFCGAVFDGTDRIQHMCDDEDVLEQLYRQMDNLVGRTMSKLAKDDTLIVLSDHGFKPLKKLVDVNAWLQAEGYLQCRDGVTDWTNTQAYTLGLSGISLNLKGRECQGQVEPKRRDSILGEIRDKLLELSDNGEHVFKSVHLAKELYQGPYSEQAPDLILGFSVGYGMNKDAGRGRVGPNIILENDRPWVADHCFEAADVPGVLFSSQPLKEGHLADLAPTILELFGVEKPEFQDGMSLL